MNTGNVDINRERMFASAQVRDGMADNTVLIDVQTDQLSLFVLDDIQHGFTEILRGNERIVRQATPKAEWILLTQPNIHIAITPNGVSQEEIDEIAALTRSSLADAGNQLVESGRATLPGDSGQVVNGLKRITKHLGRTVDEIDVQINDLEPISLTNPHRRVTVRDGYFEEYSTVDGVIDTVSVREPAPYCILRDNNTGFLVRAYYSPDLQADVVSALGKMSMVSGLVRYRRDWVPVSVRQVELIFAYPEVPEDIDAEIDRLLGSAPGLLGNLTVDEHLDDVRGRAVE